MTTTAIITTAIDILNNLSKMKFQKVIKSWMSPISEYEFIKRAEESAGDNLSERQQARLDALANYTASREYHYIDNPDRQLPDFLNKREAALFLCELLSYWSERGVAVVHSCADHKTREIWFKPCSSCGSCERGRAFTVELFGEDYTKLPFIEKYGDYYKITINGLREYVNS